MKTLKIATIGLGRVGLSRHVEIPFKHPHFKVIACTDTNIKRLSEVKEKYNVNIYTDYKAMIDKEDIDLVVIASPTNFHFEQTAYAFSKGKNVFLEKPMTPNLSQAKKLVSIAQKYNKKIMLHQQHRTFPTTSALLDGLSKNLIGNIYRVNYNISGFTARNDWQAQKKYGGGMLYNYGAHFIDVFLYVFNVSFKSVYCKMNKILSVGDAEDVVKIILETKEDITYDLDINMASNIKHNKWIIYGDKGSIIITDDNMIIKYIKDKKPLSLKLQTTLMAENRKYDNTGILEWIEEIIPISAYKNIQYYDKVYEFFALNKKPIVPIEESIKVMEILDKCSYNV